MENCLVTKLKGVVNNDRLPRLGYLHVNNDRTATDGIVSDAFIVSTYAPTDVDVINRHGVSINNGIGSWTAMDAWFDVKKDHLVQLFGYINAVTAIAINVEDLEGCSMLKKILAVGAPSSRIGCKGNIEKLSELPALEEFTFSSYPNIVGSVTKIPALSSNLKKVQISQTGISGNADCFISNGALAIPSLTSLIFSEGHLASNIVTPITFSVSSIVICANNGCEVKINESQIVWDSMTKEAFQAAYESYPTPPVVTWGL